MALRVYSDFELRSCIGYLLLLWMGLPGHGQLQQGRILVSFVTGTVGRAGNVSILFLVGMLFVLRFFFPYLTL